MKSFVDKFDELDFRNQKFLLAFSGGGDSVYLLWQLALYYQEELNKHIYLCYINYHDSEFVDIEEKLVHKYIKQYDLTYFQIDTQFNKEIDKNFEDWARYFRYNEFAKIIKQEHLDGLLTAHQKTDLVETYILQKKRNNYPRYYGLNEISYLKDIKIIRPILNISKKELTNELITHNIEFYDDITNKDPHKARTLVRNELDSEELLDRYIKEIDSLNSSLNDMYQKFSLYEKGISFKNYDSFNEEEKKRYCFYLLKHYLKKDDVEGYGKRTFDFVKKQINGSLKLDENLFIYKTKEYFFIEKDLSKVNYEFTFNEKKIYENEYFKIDLTDLSRFNNVSLPLVIRNYHEEDTLSTALVVKDVKKFLRKQGVPSYLIYIYPIFICSNKIKCVPFYKDINDKKVPITLKNNYNFLNEKQN